MRRLYSVEEPQPAETNAVSDFFKQAYQDQFNASYYRDYNAIAQRRVWYSKKSPEISSNKTLSWICKEKKTGKIIGHFGIIPAKLKHKHNQNTVVWGRDLIVLPEFRSLGIGPFLVDSVLKDIKEESSLFLVAGGNDQICSMYKNLGFTDLGLIPLYVRILRVDGILKKKFPARLAAGLLNLFNMALSIQNFKKNSRETIIEEVSSFDDSFNELWLGASRYIPVIASRDSAFLKWRFVDGPIRDYKIFKAVDRARKRTLGYIILREGKSRGLNVGIICDIFASPGDTGSILSLANFAVKYFKDKKTIDLIRCNILHKDFGHALKRLGFIPTRSNSHFMISSLTGNIDPALIFNRNNWFLSFADSDLDLYDAE